jgi:hypothetical protein
MDSIPIEIKKFMYSETLDILTSLLNHRYCEIIRLSVRGLIIPLIESIRQFS